MMWEPDDEDFDDNEMNDMLAFEQEIQNEMVDEQYEDMVINEENNLIQQTPPKPSTTSSSLAFNAKPSTHAPPLSTQTSLYSEEFKGKPAVKNPFLGMAKSSNQQTCSSLFFEKHAELITKQPSFQPIPSFRPPVFDESSFNSSYLTCTLANGSRFMLQDRSIFDPEEHLSSLSTSTSSTFSSSSSSKANPHQLLSKSYYQLLRESDAILLKKNEVKTQSIASKPSFRMIYDHTLWVDKYSPKSFTQLLSNEKINREVLKTLKKWDSFVFKNTNSTNNLPLSASEPKDDGLDKDLRPFKKVIMLCGPPGTGKTTLAHVLANHCGYHAIEINASDDRSPEALRELLNRATQNKSLRPDKRPNCIIFDEIDGMDGGKNTLDLLLDVIKAPLSVPSTKGGHKKQSFALTRPLFVICNDQYAPVLKELRRLSDIFVFTAPQDLRLLQRLRSICQEEHISISQSSVLNELITATGHDIRSCINHLQFAAIRMTSASSTATSSTSSSTMDSVIESMLKAGIKDDNLNAFQVWQCAFSKHPNRSLLEFNNQSNLLSDDATSSGPRQLAMEAVDAMQDYGDYLQLVDGLHENCHKIQSYDTNYLLRHCHTSEWFSYIDNFYQYVSINVDFNMYPYLSLIAGVVHYSLATNQRLKLEWPKKGREVYFNHMQKEHIIQAFAQGNQHTSWTLTNRLVVVDVLPYLFDIIRPRVRNVSLVSMSPNEKELFLEAIGKMEACGLQYIPIAGDIDEPDNKTNKYSKGNNNNSRFNNNNNQKFKAKSSSNSSKQDNYESILLQDKISMILEPNLDLLFVFTPLIPELAGRHYKQTQETKQLIFMEQRKYSLRIKEQRLKELQESHEKHYYEQQHQHDEEIDHEAQLLQMEIDQAYELNNEFQTDLEIEKEMEQQQQQKPSNNLPEVVSPVKAPLKASEPAEIKPVVTKPALGQSGLSSFFKRPASNELDSSIPKKTKLTNPINTSDNPTTALSSTSDNKPKQVPIRFKYIQGYSNAVRRSVFIREFL